MSRAFVKEPDGDEITGELTDLPISPYPNYVTLAGLAQLRERRASFAAEHDAIMAEDASIKSAPSLAHLAREIRYLEARIASAIPVDPAGQPKDRASFGAEVTVEDEEGHRQRFQIVGEDESDPEHGKVSWVSPLARALDDAQAGDLVVGPRPSGDVEIEVLEVTFPED